MSWKSDYACGIQNATTKEVNQKQNKRIHMGFFYYGKKS